MTAAAHTLIPLDEAVQPRNGEVLVDRWWVIKDDSIILWRGFAPQCNADRRIVESIRDRVWPGCAVRHLPVAFVGRLPE